MPTDEEKEVAAISEFLLKIKLTSAERAHVLGLSNRLDAIFYEGAEMYARITGADFARAEYVAQVAFALTLKKVECVQANDPDPRNRRTRVDVESSQPSQDPPAS